MKKLLYFLYLTIALNYTIIAQPFQFNWQNCFGGPLYDLANDITYTEDGYVIIGYYSVGGAIEQDDLWLIKTNFNGNMVWEKKLGGSDGDQGIRIFNAENGNVFIVAGSFSSDGDISNDPYFESEDFWIVKTDNMGNILWERIVGGNWLDRIISGTTTSDGGIVALGFTGSNDGDISSYFGAYDMWMVKLNSQGDKVWDFSIGTTGFDYGEAIVETSDKGFLVGGTSRIDQGGNIDCEPFSWWAEAILFKLDSNATVEWQQCYGGSGDEGVKELIETEDGYIMACFASSADGDLTGSNYHVGFDHLGYETRDIWIVKLDFSGNIIWQKCFGGTDEDYPNRIFQTEDGGYMVFGTTLSNDGDVVGNHSVQNVDHDVWVFKIDQYGELLWQQCIGGGADERIRSGIIKLNETDYVVAANLEFGPDGDITCEHPFNHGIWFFELTDTTVGISENPLVENALKVYPNPANEYVVFESKTIKSGLISISDIYGRTVAQIPVTGEKTVWDARGIQPGVYLYHLNNSKYIASGKLMIRK